MAMPWQDDARAAWYELRMHEAAIWMKMFALAAILYVFFGVTFLPAGCDAGSVVAGHELLAALPLAMLGAAMAKFSTFGSAWTPVQRRYEFGQLAYTLFLAVALIAGGWFTWGAKTDLMKFTAWFFGMIIILEFLLDFWARLARWRARKAIAPTPTT